MASSLQLHREHQELVAEKSRLSAEVDSKRKEYEFYDKKIVEFRAEHEAKAKELELQAEEIRKAQADVRVSLARTEREIQKNIEHLNDVILEKQQEIKTLNSDITELRNQAKKAKQVIASLEGDITRLKAKKHLSEIEQEQLAIQIESAKRNLTEINNYITDAIAELGRISGETANLTKLKHDLDMYYMRIKNYYKKAGLHFVDEQYVGIPSN